MPHVLIFIIDRRNQSRQTIRFKWRLWQLNGTIFFICRRDRGFNSTEFFTSLLRSQRWSTQFKIHQENCSWGNIQAASLEQCYAILLQTEEVLLLSYMFLCEFPYTFLGLLVVKRWLHVLIFASERRVCKFWFEQIFSMYDSPLS